MNTVERLGSLHPDFSAEMVERIGEIAEEQKDLSFAELAALRGIPEPGLRSIGSNVLNVGVFEPREDFDSSEAIVYRLWHGTDITKNVMMRAATLHAYFPNRQLIVIGEPAEPGTPGGKIAFSDMLAVLNGDLRPKVEPSIRLLSEEAIDAVSEIGHSAGADQAAVASEVAADYGITVERGAFSESASTVRRSLAGLAFRFLSTAKQIERYASDSDSRAVDEVRAEEDSPLAMANYGLGLLRLSNIAAARALARGMYEERVRGALSRQPAMKATGTWTGESELVAAGPMSAIGRRLSEEFPGRYHSLLLKGHAHNYADDIYRHTAVMAHSLII